jgi:hypothetical protein
MKFYGRTPGAAEASPTQDVRKRSDTSTRTSAAAEAGVSLDRIDFSSILGRLAHTLSAYDTSRSTRIQALAAEYQSGHYRPDSAATSRDMVSSALVGYQ